MNVKRLLLLLLAAAAIAAFFVFDLGRYLSLEALKAQQEGLRAYAEMHPLQSAAIFFGIYVAATALSIPGAAILTLGAGAVFGLWRGLLIVSFASSVGATLAFLAARFLLRDMVTRRFGERLKSIDQGIQRDGAFYLFTLRLVPLFPFFLINLLMGLTALPARTFYWVSQLGMLAGTAVYVNAGTQLAQISSLRGILSPGLLLSFVLLGIFPLAAKKAVDIYKARKVYAQDGRRLPQHRLRAVQGLDQERAADVADRPCAGLWPEGCRRQRRFRRRHGAGAPRDRRDRAA
jgi:uncharacterized membrane protein YdjX (TVP38/TMEM64 family)